MIIWRACENGQIAGKAGWGNDDWEIGGVGNILWPYAKTDEPGNGDRYKISYYQSMIPATTRTGTRPQRIEMWRNTDQ